ncbi:MAG: S-methyl-5'-thioinosine phosphorylase [Gammaproteobacteria bacterium]|nr:S-methyl-5'-thioinosine phosphorylase [Gammaproteobacteria bacterium]
MATGLIIGSGEVSLPGGFERSGGLDTPYGPASDGFFKGQVQGHGLVVCYRHGEPRRLAPHAINYRANLWLLRKLGAQRLIAVYAVGGIDPALRPGDLAAPHQVIDYTWGREHTFDATGATHVDFTRPYDDGLNRALATAARQAGVDLALGGVYGATQGPRLESAAEIDRLDRDGCTLVGMTGMPEAGLARELGLPLAGLCIVVNAAAGRGDDPGRIDMAGFERAAERGFAAVMRLLEALLVDRAD